MTDNQERAINHLVAINEMNKANKSLKLEIDALRYQASGVGAIRYDKERVQSSPTNFMEIALADAVEKELELEEALAQVDTMKQEAYCIVRNMNNEDERTFVINHYLNDIPVQELIMMMHMSERKLYYLREDALENYGKILSEAKEVD